MNSAAQAQSAYAKSNAIAPQPRETEYRALARVTSIISEFSDTSGVGFPRLAQAIHDNQTLWSHLAQDVAMDGNGLPDQLRAQIFYLAEFTRHHSRQVLFDGASPGILVEINTAVMRGLRARASGEQA